MSFRCDRQCFANQQKGECGILLEPSFDEDGVCHFQKPEQNVTKGVVYPERSGYAGVVTNNIKPEEMHKSDASLKEDWDETVAMLKARCGV